MKKPLRWIRLCFFLGFCAIWWFWLSGYMVRPQAYWPVVTWLVVAVFAGCWHARALYRFSHMLWAVRREEELGLAEQGSELFAENQRFRYIIRVVESIMAIGVGLAGIYAVHHPEIQVRSWYPKLAITFFIGSIAATGYLTIRDLRVVNKVQKAARQEDIALGRPNFSRMLIKKLEDRANEEDTE